MYVLLNYKTPASFFNASGDISCKHRFSLGMFCNFATDINKCIADSYGHTLSAEWSIQLRVKHKLDIHSC